MENDDGTPARTGTDITEVTDEPEQETETIESESAGAK